MWAQNSGNFIQGGKLFVESPLCFSLMLSLAISSLGKQGGGWCRKIIWTFSLTMDPVPQRGVKSAGQVTARVNTQEPWEDHPVRTEVAGITAGLMETPLGSANLKVKCAECWGDEGCEHGCHRWGWWGVRVADCASSSQTLTDVYKLMTGKAQILKGDAGLSESPPPHVLCCQPAPSSTTQRARNDTPDWHLKYWVIDTVSLCECVRGSAGVRHHTNERVIDAMPH